MRTSILTLPLLAFLFGCASIESGGFTVYQPQAERAYDAVGKRAAFELDCPKDDLKMTVLAVHEALGPDAPTDIGVEGCGKRAVYVSVPQGDNTSKWVPKEDYSARNPVSYQHN